MLYFPHLCTIPSFKLQTVFFVLLGDFPYLYDNYLMNFFFISGMGKISEDLSFFFLDSTYREM